MEKQIQTQEDILHECEQLLQKYNEFNNKTLKMSAEMQARCNNALNIFESKWFNWNIDKIVFWFKLKLRYFELSGSFYVFNGRFDWINNICNNNQTKSSCTSLIVCQGSNSQLTKITSLNGTFCLNKARSTAVTYLTPCVVISTINSNRAYIMGGVFVIDSEESIYQVRNCLFNNNFAGVAGSSFITNNGTYGDVVVIETIDLSNTNVSVARTISQNTNTDDTNDTSGNTIDNDVAILKCKIVS